MIKEKCAAGVRHELRTEYARSGRSTCRGCLKKINDVSLNTLELFFMSLYYCKVVLFL